MPEIDDLVAKLKEDMRREFGDGRLWTEEDERKARAKEKPLPRTGYPSGILDCTP